MAATDAGKFATNALEYWILLAIFALNDLDQVIAKNGRLEKELREMKVQAAQAGELRSALEVANIFWQRHIEEFDLKGYNKNVFQHILSRPRPAILDDMNRIDRALKLIRDETIGKKCPSCAKVAKIADQARWESDPHV